MLKKIYNYIGLLRIYSLLDLVLMLLAIRATNLELFGVILLHVGFLAYLEYKHAHDYRVKVPFWIVPIITLLGAVLFGHIEGLGYILASYVYTKKNKRLGWFSPFARGIQNFFIVAGIVGYTSILTLTVPLLLFVRNVAGDFRDTEKDKNEGMRTIPVILGFITDCKHIHLIVLLVTSTVWWYLLSISVLWLIPIFLIEIYTYKLTPR
jgi:1,4-dihydroxy-2-naphthoate octaprenyltransferase